MKVLVLQALLVAARWQPRMVQVQTSEPPDTHSAREVQRQRMLPWLVTKAMPAAASFQVPPARSSVLARRKDVAISALGPRMQAGPPEDDKLGALLRQPLAALQGILGEKKEASREAAAPSREVQAAPKAEAKKSGLPFFLDAGTKGGVVFYSLVGVAVPFWAYQFMLDTLKYDVVLAGNVILVGYVGLGTVAWTGSYVFRVANKDMTYAQQLKDYENAVIQKRFEELSMEEVDALMGEIYQPQGGAAPSPEAAETARAAAAAAEELAAAVGRMEGAEAAEAATAKASAAESAIKLQDTVDRLKKEDE